MNTKFFRVSIWILAFALLAVSLVGANLILNSHAGDASAKEENKPPAPPSEAAVCIGHVDVEDCIRNLYPMQPGKVAEVLVHEDQSVKKGDVLFRLEDRPATFLLRQAEADLKAAQARLAEAQKLPDRHKLEIVQQRQAIVAKQSLLAAQRYTHQRLEKLARNVAGAPDEEVKAAAEQIKAQEAAVTVEENKLRELELVDPKDTIAKAEADVAARQAQLDGAQYALDECKVRAPADGKVLRLFIGVGDMLGSQPKQPALQFCPDGPRIVRAEIEQEFANRVSVGQSASVQDDSKLGPAWKGKVVRISDWYTHRRSIIQEPLQFNDVRTLECIIQLDPHPQTPRIGQRVRVLLGPLVSAR